MQDMQGKSAIVTGVANKWSIAWGIARHLHQAGVKLTFSYQGERFLKPLAKLVEEEGIEDPLLLSCDVTRDGEVEKVFEAHAMKWGGLDYVVHSIAFAPREELEGEFAKTSREGFRTALEVSAYSLIPMGAQAKKFMGDSGGSILAMTYLASQRVVENYNVMGSAKAALEHIVRQLAYELGPQGIRVNAISAGPIQTASARGISGFSHILKIYEEKTPLKRNVTQDEVGKAALFLLGDMASAVTGHILYVDCGFNILAY